ncbi:MAG: MBL fold metallo-hydrolase, partial [Burkholderiaceae bacterium]|nr:MBL fold metallo-hydrolase [Burkholderiaceae bacterium]
MSTSPDLGSILKPASSHTCCVNRAVFSELDFSDKASFDDARRGLVGSIPDARIENAKGQVIWDLSGFSFLDDENAPDSVNPSLWRHARLNNLHGLFKVTERVYQVRGFDLAN